MAQQIWVKIFFDPKTFVGQRIFWVKKEKKMSSQKDIWVHTWKLCKVFLVTSDLFQEVSVKTRYHKVLKMQLLIAQINIFAETNQF